MRPPKASPDLATDIAEAIREARSIDRPAGLSAEAEEVLRRPRMTAADWKRLAEESAAFND
jgi:hypothetical protein